ncbi:MAG: amidase [Alicyclobacillus macrosporangiidus]|uniref:amidase n=1 Tax=Alicyclobacillus macrosporangiidus TaxID=392015 RepID=UPI0026ECD63F|nr:amidase [Alicyclobacillus macrosporangiidus]MCL6597597.1 amidase [Alicyclobacillus macrosporangiidus]
MNNPHQTNPPLSLLQAITLLERGELTRQALANRVREAILCWEPDVKAFLHLDEQAFDAIAEHRLSGPLAGMPIAVKDMIDVAGMPTTGGSKAYRMEPIEDAACVARLRAAGAVILGKTNTHELAYGVVTPPTRNPRNLDYIPGGSSGGSAAAVAAGMAVAAIGTDTGGSVRIPASCCGIVGFKPTVGRISKQGVMPLSTTYDHVGVLTHTVADARLLFHLLDEAPVVPNRGRDAGRRRTGRLAVPRGYIEEAVSPDIHRTFEQALAVWRNLGYALEEVELEPFAEWKRLQLTVRLPEAYRTHREVLEGPRRGLLQGDLAERIPGKDVSAVAYLEAQEERRAKIAAWSARLEGFDALVMPTLSCPVPRVGADEALVGGKTVPLWDAAAYMTAPWNVLGFPAISVPFGHDENGLPVGLQIVGGPMADDEVLELAAQFMVRAGRA